MKQNIEIAQEAGIKPIQVIAETLGIPLDELELYGKYKFKVRMVTLAFIQGQSNGKGF